VLTNKSHFRKSTYSDSPLNNKLLEQIGSSVKL